MVNLTYHISASKNEGFEAGTRKLLLEAGPGQLSVLLWNREQKLIDAAEVFTGIEDWTEDWPRMLQQSALLNFRHLETEIFMNSERFLPVPAIFFEPAEVGNQITTLFGEATGQQFGGDVHPEEGMVIGWEANKEVFELLNGHFEVVQWHSLGSLLLKVGNTTDATGASGCMVVSGELAWFSIWRGGNLLILKAIQANEPENVAYFMLNACKNWGIEPQHISWKVAGFIQLDSPLWLSAERFFPNFEPMEGASNSGEIPAHYLAHFNKYPS